MESLLVQRLDATVRDTKPVYTLTIEVCLDVREDQTRTLFSVSLLTLMKYRKVGGINSRDALFSNQSKCLESSRTKSLAAKSLRDLRQQSF